MKYEKEQIDNGHLWSGWPGAYCLYCFQEDPIELEVGGISENDLIQLRRECPNNKRIE